MKARITTGIVFGTAIVCLILMAPPWATYLLIQAVAIVSADELYKMLLGEDGLTRDRVALIGAVGGAVAFVLWAPEYLEKHLGAVLFFTPIFLLTVVLYSPGEVKSMGKRAIALLGGFAYLGLLVSSIAAVVAYPDNGPKYLLVLLGGVSCGDTGAYFAGRTFGNAKLYEKISPKKTWAGAVGGVFSSVGGMLLFTYLLDDYVSIPTMHCVILGIAFAAFEQTGDLAESLFKRANNIKDSGCILPGHGGMLDRIDGILFAGPIMWCWLHYFA